MEMRFVPASLEDVDELYLRLREVLLFYEPYLSDREAALLQLYRRVKDNISDYTLVKYNGEKAAYYYFHDDGEQMKLEDIYVFKRFRRYGIGTSILRRCMSETELPIFAEVYTANIEAMSLFKHHAFSVRERIDHRRCIMRNENNFPYIPELFYGDKFQDGPMF